MNWEIVMGLEVHVELATEAKIFCSCTTKFGGAPNTHCCPICTGMPGTLPVLNEQVLAYAVKAGVALNCDITRYNKFDRKNYFYPDLPKAYQISQLYLPFARNGSVAITTKDGEKAIRIHEIHMEEDAGKLVHSSYGEASYPDYNRCGVALIEIVSDPDFRTAEEVTAYLTKLRSTFQYLGISDCKMQEGSMRADINLSVRKFGEKEFGTRTEMKNMNSFKAIERAIAYEAGRQIEVIENGGTITQETRRWDDNKGKSFAMRSKENAQDYRYFPEPDIPPITISEDFLQHVIDTQPELGHEKELRYVEAYNLTPYNAGLVTADKIFATLFEETVALGAEPRETANWMLGDMIYLMGEAGIESDSLAISPAVFADFIKLVQTDTINRKIARDIFEHVFKEGKGFDVDAYVKENNLVQVDDENAIREAVKVVIANNPATVSQYLEGKTKVFGFFVGQTMKAMQGKAKPETVNRIATEELASLGG